MQKSSTHTNLLSNLTIYFSLTFTATNLSHLRTDHNIALHIITLHYITLHNTYNMGTSSMTSYNTSHHNITLQYPDTLGRVKDWSAFTENAHKHGALAVSTYANRRMRTFHVPLEM